MWNASGPAGGLLLSHLVPCWAQGQESLRDFWEQAGKEAHVLHPGEQILWSQTQGIGWILGTGVLMANCPGSSPSNRSCRSHPRRPQRRELQGWLGQIHFQNACNKKRGAGVMPFIWVYHQSILRDTQPDPRRVDSELPNCNQLGFTRKTSDLYDLPGWTGRVYVLRRQTYPHSPHVMWQLVSQWAVTLKAALKCSHRCHPYKGEVTFTFVNVWKVKREPLKNSEEKLFRTQTGRKVHYLSHGDSNGGAGLTQDGIRFSSLSLWLADLSITFSFERQWALKALTCMKTVASQEVKINSACFPSV